MDEKVNYKGASAITGIVVPTLYAMVSRRQIPHYRIGRRLVVFSRVELERWLEERRIDVHAP